MNSEKPCEGLDIELPLLMNAGRILAVRLDEMLAYEPYLHNPDKVYQLHQMRIAAKRLRYTLEIFLDCMRDQTPHGPLMDRVIDAVKNLQEILGEIHDCDVLMPRLCRQSVRLMRAGYGKDSDGNQTAGVNHVDLNASEGLLALCRRIRERRIQGFNRLADEWERVSEEQLYVTLRAILGELGRRDIETSSRTAAEESSQSRKSQVVADARKKRHEKEHIHRHHKHNRA